MLEIATLQRRGFATVKCCSDVAITRVVEGRGFNTHRKQKHERTKVHREKSCEAHEEIFWMEVISMRMFPGAQTKYGLAFGPQYGLYASNTM